MIQNIGKTMSESNEFSVSFLRHSGWVGPEDFTEPVCIIGCGAVGSHIALLAAKMGFHKFRLWDADAVEPHNLANQAYDIQHIGQLKTEALKDVLTRFNPAVRVETHPYFFESSKHKNLLEGPLIIATDSMSSRMDIYDAFKLNADISGVYEVRLAFDFGELHVVDNNDLQLCKEWKASLRDDSEIPDGPCNLRICTTLVQLASSLAVHNICSRYVALRQSVPWVFKKKVCLSLTNQLRMISF